MRTVKHFKGIPVVLSSPVKTSLSCPKLGRIKDSHSKLGKTRSRLTSRYGCTARVGMIEFHSLHKAKQFINALTK